MNAALQKISQLVEGIPLHSTRTIKELPAFGWGADDVRSLRSPTLDREYLDEDYRPAVHVRSVRSNDQGSS